MAALLVMLSFLAMAFGLVSLVRPVRRLGIRSRRTAAWVIAGGILTWTVAGATVPDDLPGAPAAAPPSVQQPAEKAASRQHAEPGAEDDGSDAEGSGAAGRPPDEDPSQDPPRDQPAPEAAHQAPEERPGITEARVTGVVDGDTVDVEVLAGAALPAARVRLIGIDTPEVHGRTDPYGAEASAFTKEHLTGRTVWLEKDVSETDRYGRALRYVWLAEPPPEPTEADARNYLFNALLVLGGYAQVSTHPPDVKYADLFVRFQREAREARKGLWGLVTEAEEAAAPSPPATGEGRDQSPQPTPNQNCDPSYPDVCIPPPPPDLDCGDIPHRGFRVLPPDPHRFDRDKDGVGCEG